MEVQDERARGCSGRSFRRRGIFILMTSLALMLGLGGTYYSWALQKYTLTPGGEAGVATPAAKPGSV